MLCPFSSDINECEDISDKVPLCQNGECTNTEGSYKCTCLPGFVASAKPHKCIPAIPESRLREAGNWVCWSAGFSAHFPPGLDSKPPTVMLKRPVSFPYIPHAHILTHVHIENTHLHSAQDALYPPHTHSRGPGIVQWMYYMGFSILQISICLKGILWTFFIQ